MAQHSYREIPRLLADRQEVKGNTLTASWSWEGRLYVVYSYSTAIALWDPSDDTLYLNTDEHSITTSRHKGCLWDLTRRARYVVEVDCHGARGTVAQVRLRQAQLALQPA